MKVKIKRFDKTVQLPEYKTKGAAGADLRLREDVALPAGKVTKANANVAIEIPKGYFIMITARSSLSKLGLMLANGIGTIDEDYCGNSDELIIWLYNFSDKDVYLEKGARVAQIVLVKYERMDFDEVDSLGNDDRGGYGSTGLN